MTILAVDDEPIGLAALESAIRKADPEAEITGFSSPKEALDFAKSHEIFVAFLDIFMGEMTGIELAKKIKIVNPRVRIVFATGFDEYMGDAFQLHASGYVLKPVTPKKIRAELDNLKEYLSPEPVSVRNETKRVRFQCFGNFEVFCDGEPLHFRYDKSKEVLGYLVSRRGALCSNSEIIVNIWEDDENHDSYLRGIRKDLADTLKEKKADGILITQRGKMGIRVEDVSCDYYDFLKGNVTALNLYRGAFMTQYSWGEIVNGELNRDM